MQLTSGVEIPDGLLAAMSQLAENSRQGFEQITGTMHWASGFVISHTSLGISNPLYDSRIRSRCTGKERDGESGNDYFEARYYSSAMGRFMSPDWSAKEEPVPYATMDDPQSLNLYSYVRNNPLSRTDPDGHCDSNGQNCSAWDHFAGAVGGALNIIPATLNLPNQAFNAISGAFNGPQIDLIPMIQADAHASQTGIDVGTAAATAVPLAAAAAEVKTAGMVVGEVNTVSKVDSIANQIDEGGFKVTQNPKTPGQDANVTITHPSEPGVNLNLRSETHPLPGSGSKPVPHVNVEKVTPRTGTSPKKIDNTHITQ
jgi:RHS repeat-associated protein